MLRRDVRDLAGVSRLVVEVDRVELRPTGNCSPTRFVDRSVAETYAGVAEPFVVPAEASDIDSASRSPPPPASPSGRMARAPAPHHPRAPAAGVGPPRAAVARSHSARRPVAVLATTASSSAATVVGAVARATGILPVVIEDHPGERRSLVRAAEDAGSRRTRSRSSCSSRLEGD